MTALSPGDAAPAFSLPAHDGSPVSLETLRGRVCILYFYPKDDTPGCTTQAQDFTALADAFDKAGAVVIGVSKDSTASHCRFREKYGLGVTLLSDEAGEMCDAYGVWVEKSMYGKQYMGIERATFLIDAEGTVRRVWRKVSVKGHAQAVLAAVEEMQGASQAL